MWSDGFFIATHRKMLTRKLCLKWKWMNFIVIIYTIKRNLVAAAIIKTIERSRNRKQRIEIEKMVNFILTDSIKSSRAAYSNKLRLKVKLKQHQPPKCPLTCCFLFPALKYQIAMNKHCCGSAAGSPQMFTPSSGVTPFLLIPSWSLPTFNNFST